MQDLLRRAVLVPLIAMLAVQTMTSMADLSVPVLAPAAAPDIGVAPTFIGVWMAILYGAAMASGLATGVFVARFGAFRICQIALVTAATGLIAFASSYPFLAFASAVLLGGAYGTVNPATAPVVARCTPVRWRPLAFSIKQSGVTAGGMLAGFAAPLLAGLWGWVGAAVCLAAVFASAAVLLLPARRFIDNEPPAATTGAKRPISIIAPLKLIIADRPLAALTVAAFLFSGIQVCLFSFFAVYMAHGLGMSLVAAGAAYAALQAGGIGGRLLWGVVADRFLSSHRLLMLLGVMTATGMVLVGAGWAQPLIILVSIALGASAFGWNGVYLSEVARLAPPDRVGEATGGAQFFFFGGAVSVPPVFGGIIELSGGYPAAFYAAAAMSLCASVAIALSRPRKAA